MKVTGVYAIRCTTTGKAYVGSAAVSFKQRWTNHRKTLRSASHDNWYLQAAWNKYGEEAFEFLVLEECDPADCIAREQHWIDEKQAADRSFGFNLAPRAGSSLGFRHTEESKAKVVAFLRGRKLSAETRAKMSAARTNPSAETRAKISAAKRGLKFSDEHRAKIGASRRGKKASDETKAKIAAASRTRRHSDETKARISACHKGRSKSAETRARMTAAVKRRAAARRQARLVGIPTFSFMEEAS